jgi:hypothetical protein
MILSFMRVIHYYWILLALPLRKYAFARNYICGLHVPWVQKSYCNNDIKVQNSASNYLKKERMLAIVMKKINDPFYMLVDSSNWIVIGILGTTIVITTPLFTSLERMRYIVLCSLVTTKMISLVRGSARQIKYHVKVPPNWIIMCHHESATT